MKKDAYASLYQRSRANPGIFSYHQQKARRASASGKESIFMKYTRTALAATAAAAIAGVGAVAYVRAQNNAFIPGLSGDLHLGARLPVVTVASSLPVSAGRQDGANVATSGGNGVSPARSSGAVSLAPTEDDSRITQVTTALLSESHYLRQKPNDATASKLVDRFLDALDPQRLYYLQSDADEFAPYRTQLDDLARGGDTSPAFVMFKRFVTRFDAQTKFVDETLKDAKFDFTGNDTFTIDRKKSARPATEAEARNLWVSRLRYEYLQEKLNGKKPDEIAKFLTRRYDRLARSLHEYDSDDVFELYLTTLAHVYDPHTDYFGKATSENFSISMRLSLFGIGALLGSEDGYARITELTPGGPAQKSKKLKAGDKIVGVAQGDAEFVETVDMKLDKVVEMVRGPKGSTVRLQILPADATDPSVRKIVTIVRGEVKLEDQAAKARILDIPNPNLGGKTSRVGVIDLPLFYSDPEKGKSATEDVRKLLVKLKQEGVTGVILDLRRNGGGSLPEAISLTGLFIKSGPVVQVRKSTNEVEVDKDENPAIAYNGPLVVLTSKQSASASEIVTGALQDYGRALVVGDTSSFGKGTVQALVELGPIMEQYNIKTSADPGTLKLTIQKFYRPSGSSTQLKGVVPDIILPSVNNALEYGEASLENPLPWDTIKPAPFQKVSLVAPYAATLRQKSEARRASDKDFAYLDQQIALLKKNIAEKTVSLNESARKKEKAEAEARVKVRRTYLASRPPVKETVYALTLADVNKPGLPKPLPPAAKVTTATTGKAADAANKADDSDDATDATGASSDVPGERDITLDEARRILLDYAAAMNGRNAGSVARGR